jgi:hypothetical protein
VFISISIINIFNHAISVLSFSHFSQVCQGSVNLVYFFKEPAFCFIDSLYGLFFGFYFINFGTIFIISLLLLVLGFAYSYFSRSLKCSIRSLI